MLSWEEKKRVGVSVKRRKEKDSFRGRKSKGTSAHLPGNRDTALPRKELLARGGGGEKQSASPRSAYFMGKRKRGETAAVNVFFEDGKKSSNA